ncbi:MAG TPA: calcium-binding protein [Bauldia sp.]|nr:calcium-binding protein [Bauldia sp.]
MPKKPVEPINGSDAVNDVLDGTNQNDLIYGGGGDDTLSGKNGNDSLFGEEDTDTLYGGNGKDSLYGGLGNDTLNGGNAKDSLYGDEGADSLYGGNGRDALDGGKDNDHLFGGRGKDTLDGGEGNDNLYGGKGKDTFKFGLLFADTTTGDTIHDFEDGREKIDLSAAGFKASDIGVTLFIADVGTNVEITNATHGKIVVVGAAGQIDASDLILAA